MGGLDFPFFLSLLIFVGFRRYHYASESVLQSEISAAGEVLNNAGRSDTVFLASTESRLVSSS